MKLNVLVYSGPQINSISLKETINALATLLIPHYTVQPIPVQVLQTQPWTAGCALLVVPECQAQTGTNRFLSGKTLLPPHLAPPINEFIEQGGSVLCLSTAAKLSRGVFDADDSHAFRFVNRLNGISIFPISNKFRTREESSTATTTNTTKEFKYRVRSRKGDEVDVDLDAEPPRFDDIDDKTKNVEVLATYASGGDSSEGVNGTNGMKGEIAALKYTVGPGKIAFWAPSVEFLPPSSLGILRDTLSELGLHVPSSSSYEVSARPLPQFLVSTPLKKTLVQSAVENLGVSRGEDGRMVLKDETDTFEFHGLGEAKELLRNIVSAGEGSDEKENNKHVVVCTDGQLPPRDLTPLFDLELFFQSLAHFQEKKALSTLSSPTAWAPGDLMFYGEVVTSTQTLLDKNKHILTHIPTPFLSLASHQLAGRGRGSNAWISPSGCLQFSVQFRLPKSFPTTKLVFIQYLFALAVVEACRSDEILGDELGSRVKIKWPNDLYIVGEGTEDKDGVMQMRKVGGILVSTSPGDGVINVVIGCGVNVLTPPPIYCLDRLIPAPSSAFPTPPPPSSTFTSPNPNSPSPPSRKLTTEKTAAAILTTFTTFFTPFISSNGDFSPFLDLYLERWLHSDQLVTLQTVTPPVAVRICGITLDHGLMRTLPERAGWGGGSLKFIDLQPGTNSFDMMQGMIKTKTSV